MVLNKLFTGLIMLLTLGCASPGMHSERDEQAIQGDHWAKQIPTAMPENLNYLSPADAYLAYQQSGGHFPLPPVTSTKSDLPAMPTLSPGDRVRMGLPPKAFFSGVFNTTDESFDGVYEIGLDGTLKLPYLPPLSAMGLTIETLQAKLNQQLESQRVFKPGMARITLSIQEWAPITVYISGAVFQQGQITINQRRDAELTANYHTQGGDMPLERLLASALRSAGGVRPTADISRIEITRNHQTYTIDLSGIVLGYPVKPIPLIHGDQIRVPSLGIPNESLITPSPITPPGIRVFISNLTVPATDNASSAVGKHSSSLPYGARLHTAVVSGNCAGGTALTNSSRYAVLVTTDPVTQRPITIEREIESLLRTPQRHEMNPYLMPNDSIVCYDSNITNLRDIGRTLGDILFPLSWLLR